MPDKIYISTSTFFYMLTEREVKKMFLILLVVALGFLVYLIVKPVLLSIIGGLLLAYIFFPVYKWSLRLVRVRTLAAAVVSVLVLALIFIPLWFLVPLMSQQVFQLFQMTQSFDVSNLVRQLFPSSTEQFVALITNTLNSAVGKVTSSILDVMTSIIVNFATTALHLLLVAFVFFFALKDEAKLREFVSGLSPLNKTQEKELVKQFKDITESIIYGQVVIGILQGVLTGLGLLLFGVDNALVLTVLAIILGIIPVIGPGLVYAPVAIFMAVGGQPGLALGYLIYNVLVVSSLDNLLRSHLVSRKTKISQAIVIIGMVGGLFIFGLLGLILGPLILAYFITFLRAYKEKNLSSLFNSE